MQLAASADILDLKPKPIEDDPISEGGEKAWLRGDSIPAAPDHSRRCLAEKGSVWRRGGGFTLGVALALSAYRTRAVSAECCGFATTRRQCRPARRGTPLSVMLAPRRGVRGRQALRTWSSQDLTPLRSAKR